MKRVGRCVIFGFQSKLELDVFDLLLGSDSPLIWVLTRGIYDRAPVKYREHIKAGRLLIASLFADKIKKPHRGFAFECNQFVTVNADEIVFAHIHESGMLKRLVVSEGVTVKLPNKMEILNIDEK